MKSYAKYIVLLFTANLICNTVFSWGFYAHRKINKYAVFYLPADMFAFYKENIYQIESRAVNADKRRHLFKNEASRHYLDLDHFETTLPIDTIPKTWEEAVNKYSKDTLFAYGILPWHLQKSLNQLTYAFIKANKEEIIRISADIGHYVADAHVPLHTTENYNGQLTNQKGIHAFWESRLPELFLEKYSNLLCCAQYLKNPNKTIWRIIEKSHSYKPEVLEIEKKLSDEFDEDKKYAIVSKNNRSKKQYSYEYSKLYHERLKGMVEKRYQESLKMVASFWYTAWVKSGMPPLDKLKELSEKISESTDSNKKSFSFRTHQEK